MGTIIRGDRELSLRFETFPQRARQRIEDRIEGLIDRLEGLSVAEAPHKTGELRSEIKSRVYADNPNRVAGYVEVAAQGVAGAYPKAASLEYGVNKPRRIEDRLAGARLEERLSRRLELRLSTPAHMRAFRYLRGPLEELQPEVDAELTAALEEAAEEGA